MATPPKKPIKKKPAPKPTRNAGLGKLKGVFQERKSRLDAAIDADTGYKPKKK